MFMSSDFSHASRETVSLSAILETPGCFVIGWNLSAMSCINQWDNAGIICLLYSGKREAF